MKMVDGLRCRFVSDKEIDWKERLGFEKSLPDKILEFLKGKESVFLSDLMEELDEGAVNVLKAMKILKDRGLIEDVNKIEKEEEPETNKNTKIAVERALLDCLYDLRIIGNRDALIMNVEIVAGVDEPMKITVEQIIR